MVQNSPGLVSAHSKGFTARRRCPGNKKAAVACRGTRIYLERTIIDSIADVKGKNGKNGID
jgi:hypothetical protein